MIVVKTLYALTCVWQVSLTQLNIPLQTPLIEIGIETKTTTLFSAEKNPMIKSNGQVVNVT